MFKKGPIEKVVALGEKMHTCKIRRSKRSRRVTLHLDIWRGIEVVIPRWVSIATALCFIKEKESWILSQLEHAQKLRADTPRKQLVTGETIAVFGNQLMLDISRQKDRKRARAFQSGDKIKIFLPPGVMVRPVLNRWCRERAREYFMEKSRDLARMLGVEVASVSIGDHKSQWGSAGSRGRLSFTWRLMLAPPQIADYVAAHEVAHLRHHNHSADFWHTVALLDPDYKLHRKWLKESGYKLVI